MSKLNTVAEAMYFSLRSFPCRCQRRNKKKSSADDLDYEITHYCSRCIALQAYDMLKLEELEEQHQKKPIPPVTIVTTGMYTIPPSDSIMVFDTSERLPDDPNNPA